MQLVVVNMDGSEFRAFGREYDAFHVVAGCPKLLQLEVFTDVEFLHQALQAQQVRAGSEFFKVLKALELRCGGYAVGGDVELGNGKRLLVAQGAVAVGVVQAEEILQKGKGSRRCLGFERCKGGWSGVDAHSAAVENKCREVVFRFRLQAGRRDAKAVAPRYSVKDVLPVIAC